MLQEQIYTLGIIVLLGVLIGFILGTKKYSTVEKK